MEITIKEISLEQSAYEEGYFCGLTRIEGQHFKCPYPQPPGFPPLSGAKGTRREWLRGKRDGDWNRIQGENRFFMPQTEEETDQ